MSSIYDSIESPLNDNFFESIFSNFKYSDVYNKILFTDVNNEDSYRKSYNNFITYIMFPMYQKIINQLRTVNVEEDNPSLPFYPIREFQYVINKYSLSEIYKKYLNNRSLVRENFLALINGAKIEDYIKDRDEAICYKLIDKLQSWFRYDDKMGFHNSASTRSLFNDGVSNTKSEIKLYLNAGPDTYLLAKLFGEECEKEGINYYFKVTQPFLLREEERCDKFCIFCELKDFQKYLIILKNIISKHPEIRYEKPPITNGLIDGIIGVGVDGEKSYNKIVSRAISDVVEKFCTSEGILFNDFNTYIKTRPNYKNILKNELLSELSQKGIDPNKICLTKNVAQTLKQMEMPELKDSKKINFKAFHNLVFSDTYMKSLSEDKRNSVYYRLDAIFSKIPLSGYFIMKGSERKIGNAGTAIMHEGTKIPAQYFALEHFNEIFSEYNGDVGKFIEDNTLPNVGTIFFRGKNCTYDEIISSYPSTFLLDPVTIKMQNGTNKIVSKDIFLRECVLPLLPENGKIVLMNLNITDADDFIKNEVFGRCLSEYGGNVKEFLRCTTRPNNRFFDLNTEIITPNINFDDQNLGRSK